MSKIISVLITFLNKINKIIWRIILFLSKFIKIEDLDKIFDKPTDEYHRLFKVDEQLIIEPFVKIEHNLLFKLYQVIGFTNQDDIFKQYRSEKQIIERHNHTLKYHYRSKDGFSSLDNANSYRVLFVTCFNFLRPHSVLNYKVPVEIPELNRCSNMPNKWIELINLTYKYTDIYM